MNARRILPATMAAFLASTALSPAQSFKAAPKQQPTGAVYLECVATNPIWGASRITVVFDVFDGLGGSNDPEMIVRWDTPKLGERNRAVQYPYRHSLKQWTVRGDQTVIQWKGTNVDPENIVYSAPGKMAKGTLVLGDPITYTESFYTLGKTYNGLVTQWIQDVTSECEKVETK